MNPNDGKPNPNSLPPSTHPIPQDDLSLGGTMDWGEDEIPTGRTPHLGLGGTMDWGEKD